MVGWWRVLWILSLLFPPLLLVSGCRSAEQLPLVDLASPGWNLQHGQAVWKPRESKPELAGELVIGTNTVGDCFVQFTKTPFTLVTAQRVAARWQIEFGAGEFSRRGRGRSPTRCAWFVLPEALATGSVEVPWHFQSPTTGVWRLENTRTGEVLEGYLKP